MDARRRLARLTLIFAIAFAVFIVTPAFLGGPFPLYPLMSGGDALDLLTPLVLLPLYWRLFRIAPEHPPTGRQPILAFFFVAYVVASLCFLGWGLYWGGLPEFSKVGIIQ